MIWEAAETLFVAPRWPRVVVAGGRVIWEAAETLFVAPR